MLIIETNVNENFVRKYDPFSQATIFRIMSMQGCTRDDAIKMATAIVDTLMAHHGRIVRDDFTMELIEDEKDA